MLYESRCHGWLVQPCPFCAKHPVEGDEGMKPIGRLLRYMTCALWAFVACSTLHADVDELRKTLFENGRVPHEKAGPEKDACRKAIEGLVADGSPEAVTALRDFLMRDDVDRKIRIEAAVALGQIGTREAVQAINEFEDWAEKRRTDPPPWRFGIKDFPIDHFSSQKVEPLVQWRVEDGTERALFQWYRFRQRMIYMAHRKDADGWEQPVLLNTPADPKRFLGPPKLEAIKAEGDVVQLRMEAEGRMRIDVRLVCPDTDRDGIPDAIEGILGTDPKDPDTDKDGVNDGADGNPQTPKRKMDDDAAQVRQAVFTVLFATSNSRDMIVMVDGRRFPKGARTEVSLPDFYDQEYRGFAGWIVRDVKTRPGFVNIKAASPPAVTRRSSGRSTTSGWS